MVVLDLQWVLFAALFLALLGLGGMAWGVSRWRGAAQQGRRGTLPDALQLLDQAPFGILVLQGSAIIYANTSGQRLLRLDAGDLEQLPSADWAELLLADTTAAHSDAPAGGRYRNVTFASGRTIRWWVTAHGDRELVVLLDVSAEERAQRTTRSLISDLGHELRTPIATLLTHLEILSLDDVGSEVQGQSLQLARREAQRMSRLVNDILELGRLEMAETLPRRPVNLMALAEDVLAQLMPQARERGIALELLVPAPPPLVLGNDDRLRQVVLNLLDNALKYAGKGSTVTVDLQPENAGVACAICDTGPGIPPEHLPYVAQRFYRAGLPEAVEGSGLGLALVSEILRRHDSVLELVSPVAQGRGTCARFTLPTATAAEDEDL